MVRRGASGDATPGREFPLVEGTDADRIAAAGLPDVGTGTEGHVDLETDSEKTEAAGLPHGRHREDVAEANETEAERIDADRRGPARGRDGPGLA